MNFFFFFPTNGDAPGQVDALVEREWGSIRQVYPMTTNLDVEWFIEQEWGAEAGNMIVARMFHSLFLGNTVKCPVCGSPRFEQVVRKAIRRSPHDMALLDGDLQLDETITSEMSCLRLSGNL